MNHSVLGVQQLRFRSKLIRCTLFLRFSFMLMNLYRYNTIEERFVCVCTCESFRKFNILALSWQANQLSGNDNDAYRSVIDKRNKTIIYETNSYNMRYNRVSCNHLTFETTTFHSFKYFMTQKEE